MVSIGCCETDTEYSVINRYFVRELFCSEKHQLAPRWYSLRRGAAGWSWVSLCLWEKYSQQFLIKGICCSEICLFCLFCCSENCSEFVLKKHTGHQTRHTYRQYLSWFQMGVIFFPYKTSKTNHLKQMKGEDKTCSGRCESERKHLHLKEAGSVVFHNYGLKQADASQSWVSVRSWVQWWGNTKTESSSLQGYLGPQKLHSDWRTPEQPRNQFKSSAGAIYILVSPASFLLQVIQLVPLFGTFIFQKFNVALFHLMFHLFHSGWLNQHKHSKQKIYCIHQDLRLK